MTRVATTIISPHREPLPRVKSQRCFTLVELLVVMGIIGILAALIMAALSKARERGRAIQCLNNLKQTGLSVHMYTLDNNSFLPPYFYTIDDLGGGQYSLTNNPSWSLAGIGPGSFLATLACPSDKNPIKVSYPGKTNGVPVSYSYNFVLYLQGIRTTELKLPTTAILFDGNPDTATSGSWWGVPTCDPGPGGDVTICHKPGSLDQTKTVNPSALGGHLGHGDYCGPCNVVSGAGVSVFTNLPSLLRRHAGRGNVVFLDGHAEQLTAVSTNSLISKQ